VLGLQACTTRPGLNICILWKGIYKMWNNETKYLINWNTF
jgi:hypothetical protein